MKNPGAHFLAWAINSTPPANCDTLEGKRMKDMHANVDEVAEKLDRLGYDPLQRLALASMDDANGLTVFQRAAIDRWTLEYRYAKKKSVELTGEVTVKRSATEYSDDELAAIAASSGE